MTHAIETESLQAMKDRAVESLRATLPKMIRWTEKVRPADGARGRFRWAVEATRPANVAATSYILGGTRKMGIFDDIVTDEDRRQGAEWIQSMYIGDGQYRDPALFGRPTPGWPSEEQWPSPGMLNGLNQYARAVLGHYTDGYESLPPAVPPPGWPQPDDDPADVLEWIRTRPYDQNAWGACSHAMRMARWLLQWHKEGRIPLQPCIDALNFFYSIQNPETGLWGGADLPLFNRINGTFKLFPFMRDQLDLPLPHADRIVDQVLSEFYRPDYDETVGACDEWDNWYVLAHARPEADGHREEEIRKMAAWRIVRTLDIFSKPDGGLSYHPHKCAQKWIGFDMAPALPQSDAMGPGILAAGICVCIDILGLQDASQWTTDWHLGPAEPESEKIRQAILAGLDCEGCR